MRNLKMLGTALVAVLALSGIAAGSASATYDLEASSGSLTGTNTTPQVFETEVGEVTCAKGTFTGTQAGGASQGDGTFTFSTVRVHPEYTECEAVGFEATVTTTGCDYVFETATTTEGTYDAHAGVEVVCSGENEIVITAPFCEITVPGGQTVGLVDFENEANGSGMQDDAVLVHSTANEIDYTGTGLACNTGGPAEGGIYKGDVTVTAENTENKQVGVQVT